MQFKIEWEDHGREPQCTPDPDFPNGKDIDLGVQPSCKVEVPYPAKRCGMYVIECIKCGVRTGVTTAGRADDPRSITIPCGRQHAVQ